jgi:hypothetical protein
VDIQTHFGWRLEFDLVGDVCEPPQPLRPAIRRSRRSLQFPERRRIGQTAAQKKVSAAELAAQIIKQPPVARQQPQAGLDVGDAEDAFGRIGLRQSPLDFAAAQRNRVHLDSGKQQGAQVQIDFQFARRKPGHGGVIRAGAGTEADLFRDKAARPMQAEFGKLQRQAMILQPFLERMLEKIRQPDLIQINQRPEHCERDAPDGEPEAAEINPTLAPEAALALGLRRHITEWQRG